MPTHPKTYKAPEKQQCHRCKNFIQKIYSKKVQGETYCICCAFLVGNKKFDKKEMDTVLEHSKSLKARLRIKFRKNR